MNKETIADNTYLYEELQSADFRIVLENDVISGKSRSKLFLSLNLPFK